MAQHLIATADAQHMPPAPDMGGKVDVPALGPEMRQIGNGRFAAGDEHQIGIAGKGGPCAYDLDGYARFAAERVKVIKIRDAA